MRIRKAKVETLEVPDDHTAAAQAHRDAGVGDPAMSSDAPHAVGDPLPHVAYNPPPVTRADTIRQKRALRRMTRLRKAPAWVKKIPWVLLAMNGFMRLNDELRRAL